MPLQVSALVITEIMHSPAQGSDTNLEWIEILNDGNKSIDLSLWKIDNSNFEDAIIIPGEYLVIARKLLGNQSFESVWGNNDSIWDESDGFSAIDGSFSLLEVDAINLSNGIDSIIASYDASSFKKGATAILVNGTYVEGTLNGTPGFPENLESEISYSYQNENIAPRIESFFIEDDYNDSGVQINSPKELRQIRITVNATDENEDDLEVSILFNSKESRLALKNGSFLGNITIYPNTTSFNLTFKVYDGLEIVEKDVSIEIIKSKSYSLSKNSIRFSKSNIPGISTASFKIKNNGDLPSTYLISADDTSIIPEVFVGNQWTRLSNEVEIPELVPGEEYEVILRIKSNAMKKGIYYGRIKVRA